MASPATSAAGRLLGREFARLSRRGEGLALVCLRHANAGARPLLAVLEELAAPCDTAAALGTSSALLLLPGLGAAGAARVARLALEYARGKSGSRVPDDMCAAWAVLPPGCAGTAEPASARGREACADCAQRCLARLRAALDATALDGRAHRVEAGDRPAASAVVGGDEKRFLFSGRRPAGPTGGTGHV